MQEVTIRQLGQNETGVALDLAWRVFLRYEAPDYSKEGVEEFRKSIRDEKWLSALTLYGAFLHGEMIGVIATRSESTHIALFFVDEKHQGQGVGRQLFEAVRRENMTVNSSPYAVRIYRRLGFRETDEEQVVNGLRFTPMILK